MDLKCLQCGKNQISHWCLDKFCQNNLICDQCSFRHGNPERIYKEDHPNIINTENQKFKIKTQVRKMMKQMLIIIDRMNQYYIYIEEQFIEVNSEKKIETYQNRLKLYSKFLQFNPQIQSALFNLNNQLDNYDFPKSKKVDQNQQKQLDICKTLLSEKQYAKASEEISRLNHEESKSLQIECQILQKNLKYALELSTKALQSPPTESTQKLNLQLQQVKILHKQQQYGQALKILQTIDNNNNNNNNRDKQKFQLQLGMKLIKFKEKLQQNVAFLTQDVRRSKISKSLNNNKYKQVKIQDRKETLIMIMNLNWHLQRPIFSQLLKIEIQKIVPNQLMGIQVIFHLSLQTQIKKFKITKTAKIHKQLFSQKFKKLKESEDIYKEILSKEPTNQKALYGLSQILIRKREYIEARELLYQLIQLNPKYRKAEKLLLFIKLKLLDQQQDDIEDQFSSIDGCLGYLYQCCFQRIGGRVHPEL
ncbi:unnamed protein product (macronuclear) [Paramecium tetraurelia]|uniref:Uncharacterized protein n=1 Tax=Paramecium tetraurelia TaxID=5888 RepID=A0BM18_PARTE|nr:uncharacterized protein GSPATT00030219001 [Paramecium tetraurelia]CAK59585.1 unnamed protein product [Paramecium tetraurelia]|eukprot:XP_001426983.1 hypothetical protein (macronuclear) [Paramecium tetraurelia strain d4-2]